MLIQTGQISGFTTMKDFKMRFAEYNPATGEYVFSNVRNGLIVGLVCPLFSAGSLNSYRY